MVKTIVALACCALIAPLGFGKSHPKHRGTTTTPITVTGTIITAAEDGAAANYQPAKTLVIRQDNAAHPGRYTLDRPGYIVDKRGYPVVTSVQPGTRVHVYYTNVGDQKVIDHVVVLD
jgi:hypothetical protein